MKSKSNKSKLGSLLKIKIEGGLESRLYSYTRNKFCFKDYYEYKKESCLFYDIKDFLYYVEILSSEESPTDHIVDTIKFNLVWEENPR